MDPTRFIKLNENCGLPAFFMDYQIRHLGNPSGLPDILLKIDPCCSKNQIQDIFNVLYETCLFD